MWKAFQIIDIKKTCGENVCFYPRYSISYQDKGPFLPSINPHYIIRIYEKNNISINNGVFLHEWSVSANVNNKSHVRIHQNKRQSEKIVPNRSVNCKHKSPFARAPNSCLPPEVQGSSQGPLHLHARGFSQAYGQDFVKGAGYRKCKNIYC